MPGEIISELVAQNVFERSVSVGAEGLASGLKEMKDIFIGAALPIGYMLIKSKLSGGDSHDKPAEVSESRIRVLKPWESGLLIKNGTIYRSVPVLDGTGNQKLVDNEREFEKKYHKLLKPGLRGGLHGMSPLRKMLIINNLPDQFNLPMIRVEGPEDRLSDLEVGIIWRHVSATDEHGREAIYEFHDDDPDGLWKAGPISAAEALERAVMTATTRAEKARQLGSILVPVIQNRLTGQSNPLQAAVQPDFLKDIKEAVHDSFLYRGAILEQANVGANYNPEVRGHQLVADAIKGLPEAFAHNVEGGQKDYKPPIDISARAASQQRSTGFGSRPAAQVSTD
jgi:hypothetical protein